MRGSHAKYIARVNHLEPCWYVTEGRKRYRSVEALRYDLPNGHDVVIPTGVVTDLFTLVPDTGYWEMHKAAHLHDWLRDCEHHTRRFSDHAFAYDMAIRISIIRQRLRHVGCPAKVIDREAIRLTRMAALYVLGVSGWVGSVYIALDKWL